MIDLGLLKKVWKQGKLHLYVYLTAFEFTSLNSLPQCYKATNEKSSKRFKRKQISGCDLGV